jgi:chromosome segregation ATPase
MPKASEKKRGRRDELARQLETTTATLKALEDDLDQAFIDGKDPTKLQDAIVKAKTESGGLERALRKLDTEIAKLEKEEDAAAVEHAQAELRKREDAALVAIVEEEEMVRAFYTDHLQPAIAKVEELTAAAREAEKRLRPLLPKVGEHAPPQSRIYLEGWHTRSGLWDVIQRMTFLVTGKRAEERGTQTRSLPRPDPSSTPLALR